MRGLMCFVTDYWLLKFRKKVLVSILFRTRTFVCVAVGMQCVSVYVTVQWEVWWPCKCHLGESSPHKNRVKDEFGVGDLKNGTGRVSGMYHISQKPSGILTGLSPWLVFWNSSINLHVGTVNVNMLHPQNFLFGVNRGWLLRICKFRNKCCGY